MKLLPTLALLLTANVLAQTPSQPPAQPPDDPTTQGPGYSITATSTLVLAPALVRTKSGQLVYNLQASDFVLTDDGVPQPLHLEDDNGGQPIAMVICVEVGGGGVTHLKDYAHLAPMLDNMLAAVPHKVAVVAFDSTPTVVHRFSSHLDSIAETLATQEPGDSQAATLDALAFSVDMLRKVPSTYRRAILLLSETRDTASHTTLEAALHAISDTNTAIYSIGFSSTSAGIGKEASKLSSNEPGPQHGCFSHDPKTDKIVKDDDSVGPAEESKGTQYYDCLAQLLPPLRLAKIAEIAALNAFRRNVSESVASLTGGESFSFKNEKTLDRDLFTIANHIPNRYVLSFHPRDPHPGFHVIALTLPNHVDLKVDVRNGYWVNEGK